MLQVTTNAIDSAYGIRLGAGTEDLGATGLKPSRKDAISRCPHDSLIHCMTLYQYHKQIRHDPCPSMTVKLKAFDPSYK
jgi:hypothetical protein